MFSCIEERMKILKMHSTIFISKFCFTLLLPMWELKIAFRTLSFPGLMKASEGGLPGRREEIFLLIRKGHRFLIVCSSEPVIEMIV